MSTCVGEAKNQMASFFMQGQQLMDLEQKLTVAKEELEKTALDKVTDWGRGFTLDTSQRRHCAALMGMDFDVLA